MKINNKKFGMYNPKYNYVFEKSVLYEDKEKQENERKKNI